MQFSKEMLEELNKPDNQRKRLLAKSKLQNAKNEAKKDFVRIEYNDENGRLPDCVKAVTADNPRFKTLEELNLYTITLLDKYGF